MARMHVRKAANAESIAIELNTENGRIVLNPLEGEIALRVEATDTAAIPRGGYYYNLLLTAPDGSVYRLLEGRLLVTPNVTR